MPWKPEYTAITIQAVAACGVLASSVSAMLAARASRRQVQLSRLPVIAPEAPARIIRFDRDGEEVPYGSPDVFSERIRTTFHNLGLGPAMAVECHWCPPTENVPKSWTSARVGTALPAGSSESCSAPIEAMVEGDGRFWLRWTYSDLDGARWETIARHRPGGGFDTNAATKVTT